MNHLLRHLAPITSEGWEAIDGEARTRLATYLAARKLVDFAGPHGWTRDAVELGRIERLAASPCDGVAAARRQVQPLVELRTPFKLDRAELDAAARGAADPDLGPLEAAARRIALAENSAVFHGYAAGGIVGMSEASSHEAVEIGTSYADYPAFAAAAVERLLDAGITGPYGLALGPNQYTGVVETTENGGYPVFEHLHHILGGPIVWAPGAEGALVASVRGGDFVLDSGEDLSIGYASHDLESVTLYLEESFTFRVLEPDAVVALRPAPTKLRRK